jgi:hypothetical protein
MSSQAPGATLPSITVRPSAAEKARFAILARVASVSESTLALMAIRAFLEEEGTSGPSFPGLQERAPRIDRITIRLRPGDGEAVSRRAAQRGMKSSTYVAALVRAHLAVNPPLPAEELAAFKRSVTVLTELRPAAVLRAGAAGSDDESRIGSCSVWARS